MSLTTSFNAFLSACRQLWRRSASSLKMCSRRWLRGQSNLHAVKTFCSIPRAIKLLLAFCVCAVPLLLSTLERAAAQSETIQAEPGVHFIVLIDDSGDMISYKEALQTSLPELLYDGKVNGKVFDLSLPRFQPGKDHVSVVFFTLYNGVADSGCGGIQRGSSALPKDMFYLEAVNSATRESFAASLETNLLKPCRFGGHLSPIATANSLILPYLQTKLPLDKLFSRTILIEATNEQFNTGTASPASELSNFQRQYSVEGTEEVLATSHQVAMNFNFNSPPEWNRLVVGSLRLITSDITPLHPTDTVLSYQQKIQIDRQAISNNKLRLAPETPHTGDLHIIKGADSTYHFRPLSLQLNFQGANSGEWKLGEQTVLRDMFVDLTTCEQPKCVDEGNRIAIPLFNTAGENLTISAGDPELTAGRINFTVGFRYETGIYDHIFAKSSEQHIEVTPSRSLVLAGAFGLFPNVKLDNKELASLWQADADGVTTQA
jgi:hypothetical protein